MFLERKLVCKELKELDELFVVMHGISQNYLLELNDEDKIRQVTEWFGVRDREVFTFKRSIVDDLHAAKD